jgi:hypothetical protein
MRLTFVRSKVQTNPLHSPADCHKSSDHHGLSRRSQATDRASVVERGWSERISKDCDSRQLKIKGQSDVLAALLSSRR